MRPTRLIYVEDDPALRGIMASLIEESPEIEILLATGSTEEALAPDVVVAADVALIDLALGTSQMNGIDLGLAMRELNDNIGIVIHSQYRLDTVARTVPPEVLVGWSTLPKTGDMSVDDLVLTLRRTARGISQVSEPVGAPAESLLDALSMRQRAIMGMAASGVNAPEIARRLNTTHGAVRQDLSAAYRVLVPDAQPSDDLRTRAVLAYLELMRHDLGDT